MIDQEGKLTQEDSTNRQFELKKDYSMCSFGKYVFIMGGQNLNGQETFSPNQVIDFNEDKLQVKEISQLN